MLFSLQFRSISDDDGDAVRDDRQSVLAHTMRKLKRCFERRRVGHLHLLDHALHLRAGDENDRVMHEYAREYLALPLVRHGPVLRRRHELIIECLGTLTVFQRLIEALAAVAVGALGAHYYNAALVTGGLSRRHALYALVKVLIQRRSAVRGNDYVRPLGLCLTVAQQEIAAAAVRCQVIARKGRDRFLVLVDHDIDDVRKLRHLRRRDHILVNGVAVEDAGAGIRAVDELGTVVAEHRHLIGHAGQHTLAAAGEAGKEMRLDKALRYQQLRLDCKPVNDQRRAGGQDADLNIRVLIAAVVHDYPALVHYLPAELCFQLLSRGQTVKARGDKQRDLYIWAARSQLTQHIGDDIPARHRARVVGNDDDAVLFALGKLAEPGAVDWIFHRGADDIAAAALGFQLADAAREHVRSPLFKIYMGLSIRNMYHFIPL